MYNIFELPTSTHAAIIAADIGINDYLILAIHSQPLLVSTMFTLIVGLVMSWITVSLYTRGSNIGHWLMGYTAIHSHPGMFNGTFTTKHNQPAGLLR